MGRMNCWEFMNCGRELGGNKVYELGVCPASTFSDSDGFSDGKFGGRACVYITGTFCSGKVQGAYQEKEKDCTDCNFYKSLKHEHGSKMSILSFDRYVEEKKLK